MPALSRHGGALPAHFDMLRSTTQPIRVGARGSSAILALLAPDVDPACKIDGDKLLCHFPERR